MLATSLLEWYIATDDQGVEGGLFFENWNAIFDLKHVRPVEDMVKYLPRCRIAIVSNVELTV